MALQSQLFSGDPKLEAAAVSDSAHIVPGSSGDHVRKIQMALIQLDGANITADGIYGPATAAAVLAYKQKRDIVNRSYQTQADNIVGKMTIASLDSELVKQQPAPVPRAPVQIKPLSPSRLRLRPPLVRELIESSQPLGLNFAFSAEDAGAPPPGPPTVTGPKFLDTVLEMRRNSIGQVVVIDGDFGNVVVEDPAIVTIAPDAPVAPSDRASVVANPQTFKVFSGKQLGSSKITVTVPFPDGGSASIDVVVKTFFTPPKFTLGVNHAHAPSGRYADVQANPNNASGLEGFVLEQACPLTDELGLVNLAKKAKFTSLPIALKHLDHYLKFGKGADFVEDSNIRDWLRRDVGIRKRLKREIFPAGRRKRGEGHFEFLQGEYEVEDFQFAFGAIDRVDFEVDFGRDAVRVWFQDRYEWHPVYPFYTLLAGDAPPRETNCLHAALVELKSSGAADYWMKGEGEVELSLIARP
jgi:hypothetical protein